MNSPDINWEMYEDRLHFCISWIDKFLENIKKEKEETRFEAGLDSLLEMMYVARLKGDFPKWVREDLYNNLEYSDFSRSLEIELESGGSGRSFFEKLAKNRLGQFKRSMTKDCTKVYLNDFQDKQRERIWNIRGFIDNDIFEFFQEGGNPREVVKEVRKKHGEIHLQYPMKDIKRIEDCEYRYFKEGFDSEEVIPNPHYACSVDGKDCSIYGVDCPIPHCDSIGFLEELTQFHKTDLKTLI
ncbi:MAG: hypothetical protein ACOC1P_02470 [Minisyncoccales bacterium]